jgi:hypothetical protein
MNTKYLYLIIFFAITINNSICFSQIRKPLILLCSDSTIYVNHKLLVFYNLDEEKLYYVLSKDLFQRTENSYIKLNKEGMYYIKLYKWRKKYPKLKDYYNRNDDVMLTNHNHKFGIYKRKPTVDVYYAKTIKGLFIKTNCLLIDNVSKKIK